MSQLLLQHLALPDAPHIIYKQPPLVLALCQVKFARVMRVENSEAVAKFHSIIEENYPISSIGEEVEVELELLQSDAGLRRQKRTAQWRFTDPQNTWTVVLSPEFLTLETRAYEDFQDFLERLKHVLQAYIKIFKPRILIRIGLRYINEIRVGHRKWSGIIRPELLGPLSNTALLDPAQLAHQQILLRFESDQGVNIAHGSFPDGSTVVAPGKQPEKGPFYLLDFDVFREFAVSRQASVNADNIISHVSEYNKAIYRLFRWSVTDEYTSRLGVRS